MFSKLGKLLTGDLNVSVLYNCAVKLVAATTAFNNETNRVTEYVNAVQLAIVELKKVFLKERRSAISGELEKKHIERTDFLTALRRQIGVAQKLPSLVETANRLKQKMKDNNWWESANLSQYQATTIIDPLVEQLAAEPFAQWVKDIFCDTIVEELKRSQNEYHALSFERVKERNEQISPQQNIVRKNLIEEIIMLFAVINAGARRENEVFGTIAGEISKLIIDTNAITKALQTRDENDESSSDTKGMNEEQVTDLETEATDVSEAYANE